MGLMGQLGLGYKVIKQKMLGRILVGFESNIYSWNLGFGVGSDNTLKVYVHMLLGPFTVFAGIDRA